MSFIILQNHSAIRGRYPLRPEVERTASGLCIRPSRASANPKVTGFETFEGDVVSIVPRQDIDQSVIEWRGRGQHIVEQ